MPQVSRIERATPHGTETIFQRTDGVSLLRDVEEFASRYVVLPPGGALAVAAWIVAAYMYECFDVFPYLGITSPLPRCGKSTLLSAIGMLACNAIPAANISEAAPFRTIAEDKPTLLLDEIEWMKQDSERAQIMRNLLNAGHRSDAAVIRCDKSGQRSSFSVFCPKALSAIGELKQTLADRSIRIQLQRKTKGEGVDRFRFGQVRQIASPIKVRIAEWTKQNQEASRQTYQELPDLVFLDDRAADKWSPLFAVVSVADLSRLGELRQAALSLSGDREDAAADEFLPLRLLVDFYHVALECDGEIVPTNVLIQKSKEIEDSPWAGDEVKLTGRKVSKWLRPFGVKPDRNRSVRGYSRKTLLEAGSRYVTPQGSECPANGSVTHEASLASPNVTAKSFNGLRVTDMTAVTDEVSLGKEADGDE